MKKLFLSGLGVLLLTGLISAQEEEKLSIPYTTFTLPNGLTVILHEDHSTPMVTVNIWYKVGSGDEKPGRTGFAHLFEHIMFEGSGNVKEGDFDNLLEMVGGNNNGSTSNDRTNYYETLPNNALDIALFLESDRMGFLLNAMSPGKVDGQRDVVKNERRQSYENRPYGMAYETIVNNLFPADHPYNWPVIGYMKDLTAASYEDVVEFFKKYYAPNNASLVIAGSINPQQVRKQVEHWFSEIPSGPPVNRPVAPYFQVTEPKVLTIEDKVQLPRLYMAWHTPGLYKPGDAELDATAAILSNGKNSRLYKRLVYELEIAQNVSSYHQSMNMGSMFMIIATARPGVSLKQLQDVIDEELKSLIETPPTDREIQRFINQNEVQVLNGLQSVGNKADRLNYYATFAGNPDWINEDLSRYRALSSNDISNTIRRFLDPNQRLILSVVPTGKTELAVKKGE